MRRAVVVLAGHSLKRARGLVIGISLVLAGFQFLLTQVAVYLMRNQAFGMLSALMPDFLRSAAGPSMLMFLSFSGVVSLGYFHPIVLAALLGMTIAIATETAAEVETRFVDLTLARPVARSELITRTLIVLVVAGAVVLGLMTAGTWAGLACCAPEKAPRPSPATIRALAVNLALIAWCWGGIALTVSAFVRRRSIAIGLTGISALAAYLLDYLGRIWDPARSLSKISPFHYWEPMSLLSGAGLMTKNVIVLLAIGVVGTAMSYVGFARRDL